MRHIIIMIAVALLLVAAAGAGEQERHGPAPAQDPRFDFLKGLEGTWIGKSGQDGMPASIFEFRVTAGGHAVEEREMVGTPMEMVTVYHMQGNDLVATHYCMLGNQPRVRAAKRVVNDTLTFDCDGKPGNAASHDEQHVHGWSMRLAGDGSLHYSAEIVRDGEISEAPAFVLIRQQETARR